MATEAMAAVLQWRRQTYIKIKCTVAIELAVVVAVEMATTSANNNDDRQHNDDNRNNDNDDDDDDNDDNNSNDNNKDSVAMVTTVVAVKAMTVETVAVTAKHAAAIAPPIIFSGVGRPQAMIFFANFNSYLVST